MNAPKKKPPLHLSDFSIHELLVASCQRMSADDGGSKPIPPFAQDSHYVTLLAKRFKMSVEDLLALACERMGLGSVPKAYKSVEYMLIDLAHHFKVRCTDCGYYPHERPKSSMKAGKIVHPIELEARLKNKCGRCHKGIDDDHDGNCGVCAHLTDDEVARLNAPDVRHQWVVEELFGGEGVRVQHKLVGPIQAPEAPPINYMNHDATLRHMKKTAGRILTVIDASFPEGTQRNALKSLIKREFRTELERIGDFFDGPNISREGSVEFEQEL